MPDSACNNCWMNPIFTGIAEDFHRSDPLFTVQIKVLGKQHSRSELIRFNFLRRILRRKVKIVSNPGFFICKMPQR